jgi:hypothetical protein
MKQIGFESASERIRKAFGRPPIAPPPTVIEVVANRPSPWGEPRVHARRPSRSHVSNASWTGIAGLCAIGLVAVLIAKPNGLAAPFSATAPAAETGSDDGTTSMPDHVTGADLDARCEGLWTVLNAQDDIRVAEGAKPGFTPAYKSAERLEYAAALQIRAQGCPVTDPAVFDKELETIRALDAMIRQGAD